MARGMTPDQVDSIETWKLAAALGQGRPADMTGLLPDGSRDPWDDSEEGRAELIRRRVMGEEIPPPPGTPLDVF